jgi:hypothetical protein
MVVVLPSVTLLHCVFAEGLSEPHLLETEGAWSWGGVLALRMLYACLKPKDCPDYGTFLWRMDSNLRRQLQPIDVAR